MRTRVAEQKPKAFALREVQKPVLGFQTQKVNRSTWWLRSCPKCGGDRYSTDEGFKCLQCSLGGG